MKCGRCHQAGHSARFCKLHPDATITVKVPKEGCDVIWRERLYGIWRASSQDENPIRTAMVSAYLQGAHDARRPEVHEALNG